MKRYAFSFLFFLAAFVSAETERRILQDANETLTFPGVSRVAVGNPKILKVRALPPATVLITGLKTGRTSVRLWSHEGKEAVYSYQVVNVSAAPGEDLSRNSVVRVGLQFIELDSTLQRSAGIRWPDTLNFSAAGLLQGNESISGLNYAAKLVTADGFIRFLVQEGWAKVLAQPELYVRLGEEAVFHSGGEMPIALGSESQGRFYRTIEWKKYGLTAKVRPESVDKLHFSSNIDLEISELNHAVKVEEVPGLIRRTLDTKMNSIDGETVILSGLVREGIRGGEEKLPVLGDIPLLGGLFSRKHRETEQTELLMALTLSLSTRAREEEKLSDMKDRWRKFPEGNP